MSPTTRNGILVGSVLLILSLVLLAALSPGPGVDEAAQRLAIREAEAEIRSQSRLPLPSSTTSSTTTTVAATADASAILAAAAGLAADPLPETAVAVANAMGNSGNARWVPYLVDLTRFFGTEPTFAALEAITGERGPLDPAEAFRFYGSWLYAAEIDAGPEYITWKAELYGLIDPDFAGFLAQVDDPVVAAEIQWGGVRRGGIPELNDQPAISAAEAAVYMLDDELTFGAVIKGEARAFPHRILDHHELANDNLGGEPVALANCTLCRTGVLFSRVVDGEILHFETSGLLRNSNKVMVDVQTESLWNQLTGEAIAGPLQGTVLERFPITVTLYGDWVAEHPDTTVMSVPGGGLYSYEPGDAYAAYYASDGLWFATYAVPDVFGEKDVVATVDLDGSQLAVQVEALAIAGPQAIDVAQRSLLAVPTSGGARFYDATDVRTAMTAGDFATFVATGSAGEDVFVSGEVSLPRVQSGHSFWFAWYGNFPGTAWWPAN